MMLCVTMAAKSTTYSSVILVPCLWALYEDTRLREITLLLMGWSDVVCEDDLARPGNCDIGTSHECETVGLKQYGTERVRNGFIACMVQL